MFSRIKNKVVRVIVIALAATGALAGIGGASVVTAEKAEAWTATYTFVDAGYGRVIAGAGTRYGVLQKTDYSWWEEVSFPWPKDGYSWKVKTNDRCNYILVRYFPCR